MICPDQVTQLFELHFPFCKIVIITFLQRIVEKVKGGDFGQGPELVTGTEWVLYKDPLPWPGAES